jgi:hypothetical protein
MKTRKKKTKGAKRFFAPLRMTGGQVRMTGAGFITSSAPLPPSIVYKQGFFGDSELPAYKQSLWVTHAAVMPTGQ